MSGPLNLRLALEWQTSFNPFLGKAEADIKKYIFLVTYVELQVYPTAMCQT